YQQLESIHIASKHEEQYNLSSTHDSLSILLPDTKDRYETINRIPASIEIDLSDLAVYHENDHDGQYTNDTHEEQLNDSADKMINTAMPPVTADSNGKAERSEDGWASNDIP